MPTDLITNSLKGTAQTCLRKARWAYVDGIRREEDSKALRMGSMFHLGIELIGKGVSPNELSNTLWGDYPNTGEGWEYEREIVVRLVLAHQWRWGEADSANEIIQTEQTATMPIVNPQSGRDMRSYRFGGKLDRIVKLSDGRTALWEFKTTSEDLSADSDYWQRLNIDSQLSDYFRIAQHNGIKIDLIMYDVTRKPTIRPKQVPMVDRDGLKIVLDAEGNRVLKKDGQPRQTGDEKLGYTLQARIETPHEFGERLTADIGERPDHYFARREVVRTLDDLLESDWDRYQVAKLWAHSVNVGHFPRNDKACLMFGRCPYFELCTSGYTPEANLPTGYIRVENVHPELEITQ